MGVLERGRERRTGMMVRRLDGAGAGTERKNTDYGGRVRNG